MTLHACTIATPNHLARARVLARSLGEQHPDARCSVLMVGGAPAAGEPFEVLAPERLGVPDLEELRAVYDPFELACALKPWLLVHLLAESPAVLYLDSDLRVYAPLDDAEAAARRHGLVLTRHLFGPLPRDGRHPTATRCWRACCATTRASCSPRATRRWRSGAPPSVRR